MPLLDTLFRTLTDEQPPLLTPGESVLVAVSGGPDSLSLLHALHALTAQIGLAALHVAHFDHQLRGDESAADAAFVAAFSAGLDLPCHLGRADVGALARAAKVSKQVAARNARAAFLETTAGAVGADKVATAHTRDDQVETVLLNILRGTGLDGLRGIPKRRGQYIRPLREVSRADVVRYCEEHSLLPRMDASNLLPVYTRNRIRLELLPQLKRDYNTGVEDALLRLSGIADRDADYLRSQAAAALEGLILTREDARLVLDAVRLRALHPALLRHTLRAAICQQRGSLDGVTHEHLEPLCEAILVKRHLPFGLTTPNPQCAIRVTHRRLTLSQL